jgi:hypothetical protein
MKEAAVTVKCMHVVAQVSVGYYDEAGNLVGEEMFPQVEGNLLTAKLFYPHPEQLAKLIETCLEQARAKLGAQGQAVLPVANGRDGGRGRMREEPHPRPHSYEARGDS